MPFFRENPDLLPAFRAGRRDVLERLYWATVERVEHIVRHGFWAASSGKRVPGVTASEVGDVVQEVFVRAFGERARNSYDGLREYTPYLSKIARNALATRAWERLARRGPRRRGGGVGELRVVTQRLAPRRRACAEIPLNDRVGPFEVADDPGAHRSPRS
jgi:DNA-directed RNA polymerase specialized sigma24 family protein